MWDWKSDLDVFFADLTRRCQGWRSLTSTSASHLGWPHPTCTDWGNTTNSSTCTIWTGENGPFLPETLEFPQSVRRNISPFSQKERCCVSTENACLCYSFAVLLHAFSSIYVFATFRTRRICTAIRRSTWTWKMEKMPTAYFFSIQTQWVCFEMSRQVFLVLVHSADNQNRQCWCSWTKNPRHHLWLLLQSKPSSFQHKQRKVHGEWNVLVFFAIMVSDHAQFSSAIRHTRYMYACPSWISVRFSESKIIEEKTHPWNFWTHFSRRKETFLES